MWNELTYIILTFMFYSLALVVLVYLVQSIRKLRGWIAEFQHHGLDQFFLSLVLWIIRHTFLRNQQCLTTLRLFLDAHAYHKKEYDLCLDVLRLFSK